jgi:hypothetical protein
MFGCARVVWVLQKARSSLSYTVLPPEKEVLSSKELGHAPHPLRLGTSEKQGIVLAREQELLAVASQLRRVQELTKYISGPFLEGGRSVHSNHVPVASISDNVQ